MREVGRKKKGKGNGPEAPKNRNHVLGQVVHELPLPDFDQVLLGVQRGRGEDSVEGVGDLFRAYHERGQSLKWRGEGGRAIRRERRGERT